MPTKRKRRERFYRPEIDPDHWNILLDRPPAANADPFAPFDFDQVAPELWNKFRERILAEWVETNPGTRPQAWWQFDSPEPRRLLKGEGRPAWERLCVTSSFWLGIPALWIDGDPADLEFESQRAYLERHELLEPGEGESIEPVFVPSDWSL